MRRKNVIYRKKIVLLHRELALVVSVLQTHWNTKAPEINITSGLPNDNKIP